MTFVLNQVDLFSAILSIVICIISLLAFRENRSRMPLLVGIGFAIFGISYILSLFDTTLSMDYLILIVRMFAFVTVLFAVYTNLGEVRSQITRLSEKNARLETEIADRMHFEAELRNSDTRLNAIIQGSPIPQFVIDKDHKVLYWNLALEEYSGIPAGDVIGTNQHWRAFYEAERPCMADLIVDGTIEKMPAWYAGKYSASGLVEGAYESTDFFPRLGKAGVWLHFTAAPVWDESGAIIGAVETLEDITDRKIAEEKIQRSLEEKEILLKEIHHRVKNNLQVVWGLLDLQIQTVKDQNTINILRDSQNRVRTMALIHETLYKSHDLSHIEILPYLRNLVTTLFSTYSIAPEKIQMHFFIEDVLLDVESAIPCGLIVNELMSNTFKHAFPGDRTGEITIGFALKDAWYTLSFKDNGVGMPPGFDYTASESLGLKLVHVLTTDQLDGTLELVPENGTKYIIRFPRRSPPPGEFEPSGR
jgi:PAS domain S-box-containing protein